ncbi:hypothetical protein [Deinococcus hopiensis]|uniref:hypothetical protein n=1 Tax=Deinococcus hopiensis TaxID=309885 RepID=UPI00111C3D35|nr:hypothetical protein [Deinococcus hopiensis]
MRFLFPMLATATAVALNACAPNALPTGAEKAPIKPGQTWRIEGKTAEGRNVNWTGYVSTPKKEGKSFFHYYNEVAKTSSGVELSDFYYENDVFGETLTATQASGQFGSPVGTILECVIDAPTKKGTSGEFQGVLFEYKQEFSSYAGSRRRIDTENAKPGSCIMTPQ